MQQFRGLNYLEFSDKFRTDKDCYDYLFSMKEEIGYKCLKCGNNDNHSFVRNPTLTKGYLDSRIKNLTGLFL